MGEITKIVIEFLKEKRDCTLVSNEIGKLEVFIIAEREGIEIINKGGKKFEDSTMIGKVHYIKYESTREEELIEELKNSLPSKRMLDVVRFGAVEVNGMLVILKSRYGYGYIFQPHKITHYNKSYFDTHTIAELQSKNVIFGKEVFGRRGLLALVELGEMMQ